MKQPPKIHERRWVTPRFKLEQLDLEFSNGATRTFERLPSGGHGAIIVVPLLDPDTVLLSYEYCAGLDRYELGLTRGRIDPGETPEQAAGRELKEEIGYGARQLRVLRRISLAPAFMTHETHLVLAEDLFEERLPGDEPEPIDVVPWQLDRLHELVLREDFSEGRSWAALLLAREWLRYGRMEADADA
jgi:ADP-ribose diphosphatase